MNNLTGLAELDIHILKYLDVNTIISILSSKNKYLNRLILDVIRIYKKDDPEYLARLLIWSKYSGNYIFSKYLVDLGADAHLGEYLTNKGSYRNKKYWTNDHILISAVQDGHIEVAKNLIKRDTIPIDFIFKFSYEIFR